MRDDTKNGCVADYLSMGSQDSFVVVVDDLFCVVHAAVTDLENVLNLKTF